MWGSMMQILLSILVLQGQENGQQLRRIADAVDPPPQPQPTQRPPAVTQMRQHLPNDPPLRAALPQAGLLRRTNGNHGDRHGNN